MHDPLTEFYFYMTPLALNMTESAGDKSPKQRFGFFLLPNFSLIALSSAVDPLRLANMALKRQAYTFVTIGYDDKPVTSSDGITLIPDQVLGQSSCFDVFFVVGPNPIVREGFGKLLHWLRHLAANGVAMGGIDTGSYYLAQAGLLDGYRCTIHWEDSEAMAEDFPHLHVTRRLVEVDRDRITCSGGICPLDMMTVILRRAPGSRELAQQVSDLLVSNPRSPDENQALPLRYRHSNVPAVVLDALELMENNIEEPLTPGEIASYLSVSRRQLERLFQEYLQMSPARQYLRIRMIRARIAVLRSNRRIDDIAITCGFHSTTHFIMKYREHYQTTPQADRKWHTSPS